MKFFIHHIILNIKIEQKQPHNSLLDNYGPYSVYDIKFNQINFRLMATQSNERSLS